MQLRQYKLTLFAVAITALVVAVYWQTFSRIVEMWSVTAYQHGWLVYPVCLYLLFTKRDELAEVQWRSSVFGGLVVALLIVVWSVSRAVGVQIVEFSAATLLIFATFWALAGTDAMRTAAFPLILLLAAVPAGGFLIEPLMRITAEISAALLAVIGVPVDRDGQFFHLPGGSFEVADVCSGLRYLLAGTTVSLAFAYIAYSGNAKRTLFVGIAAIVLVITNGVRAFIVMTIASATDMRVLGGSDHVVFGMVLFGVVFFAIILIGERYADPGRRQSPQQVDHHDRQNVWVSGAVIAMALGILISGPAFDTAMANRAAPATAVGPVVGLDGCSAPDEWVSRDTPSFDTADYREQLMFECGDHRVGLFVAGYVAQTQGKELISWDNRVWPKEWRRYVDRSTVAIQTSDGAVKARQVLVRRPEGWRLIWYWYQVGESVTGSQYTVKVLETLAALRWRSVESSIVAVSAISDDQENSDALRRELEAHADAVLTWNIERVRRGTQQ